MNIGSPTDLPQFYSKRGENNINSCDNLKM
jgi:hypothetical protein